MRLGERMKMYEHVWRHKLIRRMPVIIRVDGKAFHTFTKGLNKPFDDIFMDAMQATAEYLVREIQGCKFAYVQSDEISLLLTDYDTYDTEAWFDNNIQKMVSVTAAKASAFFNQRFGLCYVDYAVVSKPEGTFDSAYAHRVLEAGSMLPVFDARAFNLDKDEVCNYFIWRQEDCIKNSISMIARTHFSDKELHGKSTVERKKMLEEKDVFINDKYEKFKLRGTAVYYPMISEPYDSEADNLDSIGIKISNVPVMDKDVPIFKEDRYFVEKYVFIEDDDE
jgi:hypothetical protein